MLKTVRFRNFKCFKDSSKIDIAPLTIFCGKNGSGKSSILESLLLLKQSCGDTLDELGCKVKRNGSCVQLGGFSDISHKYQNDEIELEVVYELRAPDRGRSGKELVSRSETTAFRALARMYQGRNVEFFHVTYRVVLSPHPALADKDDLSHQTITIEVYGKFGRIQTSVIDIQPNGDEFTSCNIVMRNIPNKDGFVELLQGHDVLCDFESLALTYVSAGSLEPALPKDSKVLKNVYQICRMNSLQFKEIGYLAPLRAYVGKMRRRWEGIEENPAVMYEYTQLIDGIPAPKDDIVNLKQTKKMPLMDSLADWLGYFDFGMPSVAHCTNDLAIQVADYLFESAGIGASQTLPVLIAGLTERKNDVLLLEQPETGLHPKAQMCMGDFLVSLACRNRGVVVETHSDHIINRVVRRMMEDPEVMEKVRIYFVEQGDDGVSELDEILVDACEGTVTEHDEFFTQFASENMKIAQIGIRNTKAEEVQKVGELKIY